MVFGAIVTVGLSYILPEIGGLRDAAINTASVVCVSGILLLGIVNMLHDPLQASHIHVRDIPAALTTVKSDIVSFYGGSWRAITWLAAALGVCLLVAIPLHLLGLIAKSAVATFGGTGAAILLGAWMIAASIAGTRSE